METWALRHQFHLDSLSSFIAYLSLLTSLGHSLRLHFQHANTYKHIIDMKSSHLSNNHILSDNVSQIKET